MITFVHSFVNTLTFEVNKLIQLNAARDQAKMPKESITL